MPDIRPVELQRYEMGFSAPIPEEKLAIWANVNIPQAGIYKADGGYKPAKLFRQAHFHPARTVQCAGGPRSGKSMWIAMEIVSWVLHADLIWLGAVDYIRSRQEFEYIAEALLSLNWTEPRLISMPQGTSSAWSLETTWGCLIENKSLADPNAFVARAPDVIGICEPGLVSLTSVTRANERLSTRRGRLLLAGTFEEAAPWLQSYWKKWKSWPNIDNAKAFSTPTWLNTAIFPKGINDPEILKLKAACDTFDEFLLRYVGVPSSSADIIFSDVWRERIHVKPTNYQRFDEQKRLKEVWVMVDPGYSGESRYAVIAAQVYPKERKIKLIDEVIGYGLTHEQVIRRCMMKEWWPVAHRGTIDPYAGESHPLGNVSPASVWRDPKYGVRLETPQRLHVEELIRLTKSYIAGTNGWTIEVDLKCERLRAEMSSWRRVRNRDGLGIPVKANCDAIKALGYFLTHLTGGAVGPQAEAVRAREYSVGGNIGMIGAGMGASWFNGG